MNMHVTTEFQKQVSHYSEVKKRLGSGIMPAKIAQVPAPVVNEKIDPVEKPKRNAVYVSKREISIEERVKRLELDLADAHARILAQAHALSELMPKSENASDDDEASEVRRPVPVIIAEVLRDYPGVTFEEIKSVRRTQRLIPPRKACHKAVYDERKDLSSTVLGKIFNREHTSILYSVGALAKGKAAK